ncbi:hypothetical protein [Trinickia acidisoli]|uniref:hypothetical protein n=1 Tax=Trinickia acidisoli TaxID=2767482 RepID=UPI001A8CD0DD|nr:hypothetical protein [Trinickia acidisoli]
MQPSVNAVASIDVEAARERAGTVRAQGLLAGVPTLLKDLFAYPGLPIEFWRYQLAGLQALPGAADQRR